MTAASPADPSGSSDPSDATGPVPLVVAPAAGEHLGFSPTEAHRWLAVAAQTGGAFDQFVLTAEPGHAGAPEHVHEAIDEFFYVLEGRFTFTVAGELHVAEQDTFLYAPKGVRHTWRNSWTRPSRLLLTYVPGGMAGFFREAAPLMHADPVDQPALEAVNEAWGTQVVGPPLSGRTSR